MMASAHKPVRSFRVKTCLCLTPQCLANCLPYNRGSFSIEKWTNVGFHTLKSVHIFVVSYCWNTIYLLIYQVFIDCLLSIHWEDVIKHLLCSKCHGHGNEHRRWTAWPHGAHIPMTVLLLLSSQISWPGLTWTHRPIRWGVITYLNPPDSYSRQNGVRGFR